jgi:hypothetical protein
MVLLISNSIQRYTIIHGIFGLYPAMSYLVRDWGEEIKESYTFCLMVHKYHHARHTLVLYEYIFMYVEKFKS